ncbi:hypothetical protein BD410DRAFT_847082 [Rickenella mellea]|uniref:Uncharacterized protein n=1 Tax=Rickenella mellea TaxID=50990 RepID=A0A4Y7PE42_9AGAM|nr:hypothetical protein BD410DRAFT_847082 [Rickenella mellea]
MASPFPSSFALPNRRRRTIAVHQTTNTPPPNPRHLRPQQTTIGGERGRLRPPRPHNVRRADPRPRHTRTHANVHGGDGGAAGAACDGVRMAPPFSPSSAQVTYAAPLRPSHHNRQRRGQPTAASTNVKRAAKVERQRAVSEWTNSNHERAAVSDDEQREARKGTRGEHRRSSREHADVRTVHDTGERRRGGALAPPGAFFFFLLSFLLHPNPSLASHASHQRRLPSPPSHGHCDGSIDTKDMRDEEPPRSSSPLSLTPRTLHLP